MGKIGIMGGTFDPIHNGHLLLGRQAYQEFNLDAVWYMPSGQPPHKANRNVTDSQHRSDMVKLAVAKEPNLLYSDFEIVHKGTSYTANTLKRLKETYPEHEFFFIIGADSLYEIENWYHPEEILGKVVILAANRKYENAHLPIEQQIAYLIQKYGGEIHLLHCTEVHIASKEIRNRIRLKENVADYVPEEVYSYIKLHHLYQEENHG